MNHLYFALFIFVLTMTFYIYINKRRSEGFCSTCTGPTEHMYKYGDPFYEYQNYQRRRYAEFPNRVKWMNLSFNERIKEDEDQRKLIDTWINFTERNEFGDPPFTEYVRGSPLLDPDTGKQKYTNKYQYILAKYPDQPWLQMLKMIRHPHESSYGGGSEVWR